MDYSPMHPKAREDSIGNFNEVVAALQGTEFAKYLAPILASIPNHNDDDGGNT